MIYKKQKENIKTKQKDLAKNNLWFSNPFLNNQNISTLIKIILLKKNLCFSFSNLSNQKLFMLFNSYQNTLIKKNLYFSNRYLILSTKKRLCFSIQISNNLSKKTLWFSNPKHTICLLFYLVLLNLMHQLSHHVIHFLFYFLSSHLHPQ